MHEPDSPFFTLIPCLVSHAQVTVTLQSRDHGNLLDLDTVIAENLTQPGRLLPAAPPDINTYDIDLLQGKTINDVPDINGTGTGLQECSNMPGRLRVRAIHARQETRSVSLFSNAGEIVRQWNQACGSGMNMPE